MSQNPELSDCIVWTSTLQRTLQTVKFFPSHEKMASLPLLNEIDAGKCEGMTYEEIAKTMPEVCTHCRILNIRNMNSDKPINLLIDIPEESLI